MDAYLSVETALGRVLEHAKPLAAESVRLADASGRVLARSAAANANLPPFASSAMDGYAVQASDLPGTLPVVARIAAGRPASRSLAPGEAMGIATGGVVPAGANAVVPIENVVEHDNNIEIASDVEVGANIRPAAGDIRAGAVAVAAGSVLTPGRIAALAACGVAEVWCSVRPRVTVLATGTELRAPGEMLGPGEIYESNGIMLEAALELAGARVARIGPVPDDELAHREAIASALAADVVVTSGGVSVGPHDLVRRICHSLGVQEVFWGVAMRPGKPLAFGVRDATLVFGLPGNPVSSLISCLLFVQPAVLALQGAADPRPFYLPGVLASPLRRNPARDDFVRARATGSTAGVELLPISGQDSHMIVRSAVADALIHVPKGEGTMDAGAAVRYLRL